MMARKGSLGADPSRVNGFDLKSFLGQEPFDELAEFDVIVDYQDLLAGQLRLRFHDPSHSIGVRVRCSQEMLSTILECADLSALWTNRQDLQD